ncbi:MAG: hypothetical protein NVSMB16_12640 [Acidimicrobiales bacterium]
MTGDGGGWNEAYRRLPPWEIGHPQPAFVALARVGKLNGRLLDAGCGTGEHTLLAARHGADALGIDVASTAVEQARTKATQSQITARFTVASALQLQVLDEVFDVVLDSGLFHVFDDPQRQTYVQGLGSVLVPGGHCYLMCFSEHTPGEWGPRRVTKDELCDSFHAGWTVESIEADHFELTETFAAENGSDRAEAWLTTIRRTDHPAG